MSNRKDICISIEYFQYLESINAMYEGYVKGLGYAYVEYVNLNTPVFFHSDTISINYNIFCCNPIPLQRVDTSKEAISRSLKFFFVLDARKQIDDKQGSVVSNEVLSNDNYYKNAQKYINKGIPYKFGGMDSTGMDCSGFVSVALNLPPKSRWTTGSKVKPAADLEEIEIKTSSYEEFIQCLQEGDILLWEEKGHVAFYAGNKSLIHASYSRGVAKTNDLVLWWLPNKGYPNKVYRQIKK